MKIDYRETKIHKYFPQAEIENLTIGDIVYSNVCIERKTGEDFLSSITDNRIFNQSLNMRENYKYPIIIVESDLSKLADIIYFKQYRMTIEQVRGATASIYVKYGVPILFCSTRNNFVELVNLLVNKSQEECNTEIFEPPVKKLTANPKLEILMRIPGIGIKKAKKILDWYGEFHNIGILEKPPGVSDKDLENILEVLK